jgi:hypothetical protein
MVCKQKTRLKLYTKITCKPKFPYLLLYLLLAVCYLGILVLLYPKLQAIKTDLIIPTFICNLVYMSVVYFSLKNIIVALKIYTFLDDHVIVFEILKLRKYIIDYKDFSNYYIREEDIIRGVSGTTINFEAHKKKFKIFAFSHSQVTEATKHLNKKRRQIFPYEYPPIFVKKVK